MKVMIGALAHESNDFCPHLTTREMFEFYSGDEVARHLPVADIFEEAGVEVVPSIYAAAEAYGPVEEQTFLYFEKMILDTCLLYTSRSGLTERRSLCTPIRQETAACSLPRRSIT